MKNITTYIWLAVAISVLYAVYKAYSIVKGTGDAIVEGANKVYGGFNIVDNVKGLFTSKPIIKIETTEDENRKMLLYHEHWPSISGPKGETYNYAYWQIKSERPFDNRSRLLTELEEIHGSPEVSFDVIMDG